MLLNEDSPILSWYPHPEYFRIAHERLQERNQIMFAEHSLFGSQFAILRPQSGITAFLTLPPELSLFNKLHPLGSAPRQLFVKQPFEETHNLLVFVHSSRGNHYFLGNRQVISFFQQEEDSMAGTGDFNGIGRFLLLRVENPTDTIYLRFSGTKTVMRRNNTGWSNAAVVLGATTTPLHFVGNGAVNRIVGPLRPVWVDGAAYIALDFQQKPVSFPYERTGLQALYNTDIAVDFRRLIGFGRDISALSPAEYMALERPRRAASFPRDLTSATGLEFSGIFEDGWVSPEADFTFGQAQPGDLLRIKGYFPQLPGQNVNGVWSVSVNGGEPIRLDAQIGPFDWLVPVAQPAKTTRVSLRFPTISTLPGGDDRPVGAKLELIEVAPPPSQRYDFATVGATRLAAQGIDQDGWCTKTASFVLPAQSEAGTLAMRFEYPGWGGNGQLLRVRIDGKLVHTQNLTPGITEVSLALAASSAPQTVELLSKEEFPLPSSDGRRRTERLLTVELQPARSSPEAAAKPVTTGIDPDGWIEPQATVIVPAQAKPAELLLRIEYPGWSSQPQAAVRVGLTGLGATAHTLKPGENQIRVRLPDATMDQTVQIEGDNSFALPAPDGRRRIGRLLGIEVRPMGNSDPTGGLAAQGIDTDGWLAAKASVVVPAHPAPAELEFRFEYPGWSGHAQGAVSINVDGGPNNRQTLDPGETTVSIVLPPSATAQSVHIEGEDFVLPAPDGRRRVCRLLATVLRPRPIP
jgi:hypothetical protein